MNKTLDDHRSFGARRIHNNNAKDHIYTINDNKDIRSVLNRKSILLMDM